MGWSLEFDQNWNRWIGYGVPAVSGDAVYISARNTQTGKTNASDALWGQSHSPQKANIRFG